MLPLVSLGSETGHLAPTVCLSWFRSFKVWLPDCGLLTPYCLLPTAPPQSPDQPLHMWRRSWRKALHQREKNEVLAKAETIPPNQLRDSRGRAPWAMNFFQVRLGNRSSVVPSSHVGKKGTRHLSVCSTTLSPISLNHLVSFTVTICKWLKSGQATRIK